MDDIKLLANLCVIAGSLFACAYGLNVWREAWRQHRDEIKRRERERWLYRERDAAGPILLARDMIERDGVGLERERWRPLTENEARLWILRGRPALGGSLDALAA